MYAFPVLLGYSSFADPTTLLQREAAAMPFVRTLSRFRDQVRKLGRTNPELMALCDKLRDEDLVQLGVALDDQPGRSLSISF